MEGLTSMSLLFIYRKSQKSQHKSGNMGQSGTSWCLENRARPQLRSCQNILSNPGCEVMMLTSQTGILMLV